MPLVFGIDSGLLLQVVNQIVCGDMWTLAAHTKPDKHWVCSIPHSWSFDSQWSSVIVQGRG